MRACFIIKKLSTKQITNGKIAERIDKYSPEAPKKEGCESRSAAHLARQLQGLPPTGDPQTKKCGAEMLREGGPSGN